ncbi:MULTISPECIES: HlyD family secretion protein [Bradyrhizobium]|jgi:multidrug efflux system membrane fusion protein|uniref:HlyD family secretion protein n=1 Tax=Bradyrhizobium TaxID=374 RepID=UPI000231DBE7|nr:HlyD family secretion protein [Bradyrhizobium japonicum]AJA65986.1 secretion protein HlyD [Bradyrhizobium japonicum]KMJ94433.1 secretion protein HlyD [Bradyrhizobium japonicum]MBR0763574.1 HlyD family secretion protein [Bradyrhizobium japonicum]MCP1760269.1 multidrug efflux system membrane fusion protein [Bradyrhizobium japonicum]MCP1791860.1 multidrug efflux system membrane fusion protein [Bradyrhizobium japonicum]
MTRGRRVGLAAAIALALFVAYEVISSFVAFTDDAYVQSDLIALAPQVTGRIIAVDVADNQDVAEGDLLASIDPVPFQLAVDQRRADLAEARAQIASDQHRIASTRDALAAASSAADFARENEKRLTTLASAQDVSRVALDQASDTLRRADAARDAAQESVAAAEATLSMHQATEARAVAALALAEWQLARTKLAAPTSGTVTSLSLRVGDTAQADVPLIGIVDARAWRIVANFKESYIRGFTVGSTAWVSLDSNPWHLRRARVAGIARGISREAVPNRLLNYVAPTTDWIRLKRRFPVTLTLVDPPSDLKLYMGADARVVVLP